MSSQDTTVLLYPVMSSCGDPVSTYSYIFQQKFPSLTLEN